MLVPPRKPLPDELARKLPLVRVSQVWNYLTDHGWWVGVAPRGDMIEYFPEEDRDKDPFRDLFPISESCPGYAEWVDSFVRMLSQCEQRSPKEVIDDLLATGTEEPHATTTAERRTP